MQVCFKKKVGKYNMIKYKAGWCSTITLLQPCARDLVEKMGHPGCSFAHQDTHSPENQ